MLDVHPPHHPVHAWRDFFIHIATICVGLLIAIGLEQSVEAVHHHHQLQELREGLRAETEEISLDAAHTSAAFDLQSKWLHQRLAQVGTALATHQPIPNLPRPVFSSYDIPADPTWQAAKSSGLLELMPQEEVKVYSESSALVDATEGLTRNYTVASNHRRAMEEQLTGEYNPEGAHSSGNQIANASPADLIEYQRVLRDEIAANNAVIFFVGYVHRAEVGILHGARSLEQVEQAEKDPALPADANH